MNNWDESRKYNEHFNLLRIETNGASIDKNGDKEIQGDKSNIEFYFDFVTFKGTHPGIKYVLSGLNSDSGRSTFPEIKFNNLSPGNYLLSVWPDITNGSKLKISIPIYVRPVFWQTTIFKFLMALLLVLLVAALNFAIIRFIKGKKEARMKNEQSILEYKLIALKAQVNPHFMSNCLSAIQQLIISNETRKATFYIAKFGLLMRQILDFSSEAFIT
jgi:hypothetical protein